MLYETVYAERRTVLARALAARCGQGGVVLLLGHDDVPYTFAANPYPFRQDSSLLYYTGLRQPGVAVLIDLATGETDLVCDPQSNDDIIWSTRDTPQSLAERSGAQRVMTHFALAKRLTELRVRHVRIHCLPASREVQRQQLIRLTGEADTSSPSDALIQCVVHQREVKSGDELAQMEAALVVTADMHERARQCAAHDVPEIAVVNVMNEVVATAGVRMAYPPICTREGQILHHLTYGATLSRGDLLLIDAGTETIDGYASDITRTHCIGGEWSDVQGLMRDAAKTAQAACAASARPGVPMAEIHRLAAIHLIEGLAPLGLFRGSTEAVLESGAYALIFPHGVGHLIGLDVHDMESLGEDAVGYDAANPRDGRFGPNHLRLGKALREGMTITLEPGVYFIPQLWHRWREAGLHKDLIDSRVADASMRYAGLRVEDNYVIESQGARRLGPDIAS
jgi:Xaa-Pro aminopeptidase